MVCDTKTSHTQHSLGTKKWETKKLRSHGICVVVSEPKVTDAHEKRFPGTERRSSARGSLPKQFSVSMRPGIPFQVYQPGAAQDITTGYDLHATILHQMGLDHEKLTYRHGGRDWRLTDVHGHVVKAVLA